MTAPVTVVRHGALALVTIDNPPVNATGQAVRAGLVAAAASVAADPDIKGMILHCAGRTFVAGADITEFGRPPEAPFLRDAYAAVEALDKPVLAVLHGTALGGGLELALSCHYRVIDPAGSVGLPEVTLGIIPGAGGTQRLPRLIGAAASLDMVTSGRRVEAAEALRLGIVDAITTGDRLDFAISFLLARLGDEIVRVSTRACPTATEEEVAAARTRAATRWRGEIARVRAIDVIAGSSGLAFAEGENLEHTAFESLRLSAQSKALRHIFFAERAIAKVPGAGVPRALHDVGVVGGGTMGAGIAMTCLLAGLKVRLVERDGEASAAARSRIETLLGEAVQRGKLTPDDHQTITDRRLSVTTDLAVLSQVDLAVEAVFESMQVKQDLFRTLDPILKPGAVLATNTSYLDVAALASVTSRPADVIGLHFFSPAHIMKLLEVVVPDGAGPDVVATGFALAKRLGKLGLWTGNAEGFIGNRILSAYRRACDTMVEDGASPFEIDAAFRDYGFPMGIYAMQDMAGLDIGWATRKRLAPTRDPAERYVAISDRICERGWFGRKTGRGYYVHEGGPPRPNPDIMPLIEAERRAKGIEPRDFSGTEIQDRALLAMVNEGAKVLESGIALRAGDIDVAMVNGYGFPRWRGGPMHAGEARGLRAIRDAIVALASDDPLWRISGLLNRLADADAVFPDTR